MDVLVGSTWIHTDLTGTAGHIATTLATEAGHNADTGWTLKADGVVLTPGDTVPAGARCEIVEHVPDDTAVADEAAPEVTPEPEPEHTPIDDD
jgi:hypothetical protein